MNRSATAVVAIMVHGMAVASTRPDCDSAKYSGVMGLGMLDIAWGEMQSYSDAYEADNNDGEGRSYIWVVIQEPDIITPGIRIP